MGATHGRMMKIWVGRQTENLSAEQASASTGEVSYPRTPLGEPAHVDIGLCPFAAALAAVALVGATVAKNEAEELPEHSPDA